MVRKENGLFVIGLLTIASLLASAEPASREVCESSVVTELNQSLREEANSLKDFLETRKQNRLDGRDRVEACSHWSVMNSYARSMSRRLEETTSQDTVALIVERIKSDLEGNTDCWTSQSPAMSNMLDGVRIILSRTTRIGTLLTNSDAEVGVARREISSPR